MSDTGERRGDPGDVSREPGERAGERVEQPGGELAKRESRYPAVRPGEDGPPPPPPDDDGWRRFSRWWGKPVTALGVLALLVLAVGFALALLLTRPNQTVQTNPTPTATVTQTVGVPGPTVTITGTLLPGPSGTPSPDDNPQPTSGPGGRTSLPPIPANVAIHQTGQFNASDTSGFDLDANLEDYNASTDELDLFVRDNGVFTTNRAILARSPGQGRPQIADCAKLAFAKWGTDVLTKDIAPNASYCVITNDDRYGFFTMHSKTTNQAGTDLERVAFSFTIWTGPDD